MNCVLSILTPSVPSRSHLLAKLMAEVEKQTCGLPVEHLVLIDNKRRTIGEKRQALLNVAQGQYIAFVDDDDRIRPEYVRKILWAAKTNPGVITFEQMAYFEGVPGKVIFHLGQANEAWSSERDTQRAAWHVCAWDAKIARRSTFPAKNYGEDWAWADVLNYITANEVHIPEVLHEYHYRTEVSEAHPEPTTE